MPVTRTRAAATLPSLELLIFDFDGTLADSEALLTELVVRALRESGLRPLAPESIGRLIGLPLAEVLSIASGVPAERLDGVVRLYRQYADTPEIVARFELFPGVRGTLEALAADGRRLAIATSKNRAITQKILVAVGLDDLIEEVVGGDSVRRGKPDPEAVHLVLERCGVESGRAALVGDTTYDVHMGRAAGIVTIAATYGMHDRETLAAAGPDHFIDAIGELLALSGSRRGPGAEPES